MHKVTGSCDCLNIQAHLKLSRPLESYSARVCDCKFCCKHGASYISDPDGHLAIELQNPALLGFYRQGSETAEFLFCNRCAVLLGAFYREGQDIYAAINCLTLDAVDLTQQQSVSPKFLSPDEKIKRWKQVWFKCQAFPSPMI